MNWSIELALVARVGEARTPVLIAGVNDPEILNDVLDRAIEAAVLRAGTLSASESTGPRHLM